MVRVEIQKWGQSLDDLRRAALYAEHPRTRERFLALSLIADGTHNATACAARFGRQDETDLNPIERLWDWMREEVTRGHCHASLKELRTACQRFIAAINGDPETVVDRLWPRFELDPEYEAKLLVST